MNKNKNKKLTKKETVLRDWELVEKWFDRKRKMWVFPTNPSERPLMANCFICLSGAIKHYNEFHKGTIA